MSNMLITTLLFLFILSKTSSLDITSSTKQALETIQIAQTIILQAMNNDNNNNNNNNNNNSSSNNDLTTNNQINHITFKDTNQRVAWSDCAMLYDLAEPRLARLLENRETDDTEDGLAWLSGLLTSHRTCLDGLRERGVNEGLYFHSSQNLTRVLHDALGLYAKSKLGGRHKRGDEDPIRPSTDKCFRTQLSSWNPENSRADIVVAKDGSGNYRSINDALDALHRMTARREGNRVVVYVKEGVYDEKVEIKRKIKNVMFIGDGINRTIITGRRNVVDGYTTVGSATFAVYGDGFWARDMTFENTAGPQKHQAVALLVASDFSLFYRCSFKGYQDTLYVHSLRQFYRDCQIYGTIDFIFGNAAVVIQNSDIVVRRPMAHQSNMVTAQGRETPYENTGISIHGSRIRPALEFEPVMGAFRTFLGRPWKEYARTVIARTYLDGFIHPKGWAEWSGDFALSTLYYAEYMNMGRGASVRGRVKWDGFHVLREPRQVRPFTVRNLIQGEAWIRRSGVPIWDEI